MQQLREMTDWDITKHLALESECLALLSLSIEAEIQTH